MSCFAENFYLFCNLLFLNNLFSLLPRNTWTRLLSWRKGKRQFFWWPIFASQLLLTLKLLWEDYQIHSNCLTTFRRVSQNHKPWFCFFFFFKFLNGNKDLNNLTKLMYHKFLTSQKSNIPYFVIKWYLWMFYLTLISFFLSNNKTKYGNIFLEG